MASPWAPAFDWLCHFQAAVIVFVYCYGSLVSIDGSDQSGEHDIVRSGGWPSMSRIERISIERRNLQGSVPEWTDSLITCVAREPLSWWNPDLTSCVPIGEHNFNGNIEFAALGSSSLAKVSTKTPHKLRFSPQNAELSEAAPLVFLFQMSDSCRVEQHNRSCTLHPGDWAFVDTSHPFQISSQGTQNENLSLRLERPFDQELLTLVPQGVARSWHGTTGPSRILHATVRETFSQISCVRRVGETGLQRALAEMAWTALRDQFEEPTRLAHQDLQRARVKKYIESKLDDPDLSLETIAEACSMSLRSLHRAFAADPAGSVSKYLWTRRLNRCAVDLRDRTQVHRQVTDICFTWGFNSTSHFSRMFKEQFGASPRDYRMAFQNASLTQALNSDPGAEARRSLFE